MKRYTEQEEAIVRTIAYAYVFDFPLTEDEILHSYISPMSFPQKELRNGLQSLIDRGVVTKIESFISFSHAKKYIYKQRTERELFSQEKIEDAKKIAQWFSKIPTVLGVFVTGGVSVHNASKNDDIDFMIITKAGKLWITRLIIVFLSKLFGKYRERKDSHDQKKDSWCLNLWIDETSLTLQEDSQNIYTAHEVIQATPVFEKEHIYQRFLSANTWITHYFPDRNTLIKSKNIRKNETSVLEKLTYLLQQMYMSSHKTIEKVSLHKAFFHPRDTSRIVQDKYNEILRSVGVSPYPVYTRNIPVSSVYTSKTFQHIKDVCKNYQSNEKKIVLATGVFDLLHEQHVTFLEKAKKEGDILVVAIESDVRTRQIKGKGRPIDSEKKRLSNIRKLTCVDHSFILPEDFASQTRYIELLYFLKPDIYACSEHTNHKENKSKLMDMFFGKLKIVHEHVKGVSTTEILHKSLQ